MSFGKVVQVMGPSVDIQFDPEQLPQFITRSNWNGRNPIEN